MWTPAALTAGLIEIRPQPKITQYRRLILRAARDMGVPRWDKHRRTCLGGRRLGPPGSETCRRPLV
jgi:hypothetical protein